MNIILLSGGSGKRLWPLSNDIRSKQFIKIFQTPEGGYESMVQRVYHQIRKVDPDATVTIATSRTQVSAIHNQLGEDVGISIEPCRRDTFPAIALATAYLHDVQGVSEDEAVVVCPVDPYVEEDYFTALKELGNLAKTGDASLVLMGIEPTYPSEKYGYIIPADKEQVSRVSTFKEKPDVKTAEEYIQKGALWNGGVFAYKLKYVLDKAHELLDFIDYQDLFGKYDTLMKISFDYAVVEKEDNIEVMRFAGEWKDLGTWNTLTEAMEEASIGEAILNDQCENVHVINELEIPVVALGLNDMVVVASADGILVSDKHASYYMGRYVEQIDNRPMYEKRQWGEYKVLDFVQCRSGKESSLTKHMHVEPGRSLSYQMHHLRDEIWTIIDGKGLFLLNGEIREVVRGDVLYIPKMCRHGMASTEGVDFIEVQLGNEISASDKVKFILDK